MDLFIYLFRLKPKGTIHYLNYSYFCLRNVFCLSFLYQGKTFWNTTNLSSETTSSEFDIQQRTIPLISFESFSKQSSKTGDSTVREIFMKQLLQIKLLTIDKANAIVDKYPTPKKLYLAYEKCTSEAEREKLLNLPYGPAKTMIGLKLSKTIYQLFMSDVYGK